ncbi:MULTISPECIES: 8-oxoguanine DNA glycosylase OGG fold protein [Micrococcus]|uniref:8-oxoguanine DNA glycosylase OGG fold protein n=1 Tax=Micrococcus luteus TaxID=1270 RepID=UPI0035E3E03D
MWGYGRVGYGPSRVERIMAQPGFEEQLADVTRITLEQGGPAAFEHIRQQRKSGAGCLKHLGAAFGTKYLYFLTKAHRESDIAPILDSVVRAWFAEHVRRGGLGLPVGLLVGRRNAAGGDGQVPGASPGCGLGAPSESDTMHTSMHASDYSGPHDFTLRPLMGQSCHGCRPPGPRRRLAHRPR